MLKEGGSIVIGKWEHCVIGGGWEHGVKEGWEHCVKEGGNIV